MIDRRKFVQTAASAAAYAHIEAAERCVMEIWSFLAPPPQQTIAEWADAERVLPTEGTAEPGRWRTARVPYLREVMDVIGDRQTETVVLMKSSQVGGTEVLLNTMGYHMHRDPAAMMLVEPILDIARAVSKDRIMPTIRVTPALAKLVSARRAKDGANSVLHKTFPGGHLTLAGAKSPSSLASRPIRVLLADEIDRWPESVGEEGDPMQLAMKRTTTFRRRKHVLVSTPLIKDISRIETWYEQSDQRRYYTPCPRCEERFVLAWEHVRWVERDPSTAYIECPLCQRRIEDHERSAMIAAGQWVAAAAFAGIAGFHMWEIFSPWKSLPSIVAGFLASRVSLEARQAWTNTSLGKSWEAPSEKIEASSLLLRREQYAAELPAGVKIVTVGTDTQDDRLEALVIGWGEGEESWTIAHAIAMGDPNGAEAWKDLDELLGIDWQHERGGALKVQCALVDSAGHKTQGVYNAIIPRQKRRVYASIGRPGGKDGLVVSPPKTIKPKQGSGTVQLRTVDTDQVKSIVYSRLKKIEEPGPEYMHFPMSLGETFFDELTAERLITTRNKYGVPTKHWEVIKGRRNEALDCFVLALAALRVVAPTPVAFARLASSLDLRRQQEMVT